MKKNLLIGLLSIFILSSLIDSKQDDKYIYVYNGPWEELPEDQALTVDVISNDTVYLTEIDNNGWY